MATIAHGQQSLVEMMHAAAEHKLEPLLKAMQCVEFQTASIPLTRGFTDNLLRKFLGNKRASRASLTWGMLQSGLDEGMLQSGLDECSTWTCYSAAWTSASSGIVVLQMKS